MFDFNIAAAKLTWRSEAYSYYVVYLQQEKNIDGSLTASHEVFHVPHQFQLDSSGFKWNPLESTRIFEQI